jgi:hypothetical protein
MKIVSSINFCAINDYQSSYSNGSWEYLFLINNEDIVFMLK